MQNLIFFNCPLVIFFARFILFRVAFRPPLTRTKIRAVSQSSHGSERVTMEAIQYTSHMTEEVLITYVLITNFH